MRHFHRVLGIGFVLLALGSAACLISGYAIPDTSLGPGRSLLALFVVLAFGVSLILRSLSPHVPERAIGVSRIAALAGLGLLLLLSGFDAGRFSTGDRVVLLFVGAVVALAAAVLVHAVFRRGK